MNDNIQVIEHISCILKDNRFGVLATIGDDQPHASLIGVTWFNGYRRLVFITYRNTRKHSNISNNGRVAVLVESGSNNTSLFQERSVLTAFGNAEEISFTENDAIFQEHLIRHPDLLFLSQSKDCALMLITVDSYQVVRGVDDVKWLHVDDNNEQNQKKN